MARTASEICAHLQELRAQREELWHEFDASMAIQRLWPEAFDFSTEAEKVRTALSTHDLSKPDRVTFQIKRPDGQVREFPLWVVPDVLLEPHFKQHLTGDPREFNPVMDCLQAYIIRRRKGAPNENRTPQSRD